ncbi:hypothetical protein D3C74_309230 [compost metagenome]
MCTKLQLVGQYRPHKVELNPANILVAPCAYFKRNSANITSLVIKEAEIDILNTKIPGYSISFNIENFDSDNHSSRIGDKFVDFQSVTLIFSTGTRNLYQSCFTDLLHAIIHIAVFRKQRPHHICKSRLRIQQCANHKYNDGDHQTPYFKL